MGAKTKAQLLAEIEALKKRLVEQHPAQAESPSEKQNHVLGERAKELKCMYSISHLVETPGISLLEILQGCVELLPHAWQYPQITCVRVTLDDQEYKTVNFRETKWKLASGIKVEGKRAGSVEVFYLEKQPKDYEGPFLKEERVLIDAVAERLGRVIQRVRAQEKVEHLTLVLHAIRNVNQLIIREKNRDVLIHEICDTLIETRGYSTAWIMLFDERGKYLDSDKSGLGKSFTPLLKELKRGDFPACVQQALAQLGPVKITDPSSTCADCPITDKYSDKGRMTMRLEHAEKVYGVISVSFGVDITIDEEELSLFDEVAGDIAFALYNIKLEENIKQAAQNLQKSAEFQKTIFETTSLATIIIEEDTTLSMVNVEFENLSGYSKEELEGKMSWTEFVAAEDLKRMKDHHQQWRNDPDAALKQCEFQFINRKGIVRNILLYVDLIPGTKKSVASLLDITEQMQSEQEIEMQLALSRQASAETDLDDLLFFIADQVVEVIPSAEAASIFLYDEERNVIKVQAWAGFTGSEIKGLEFSVDDSQVGEIFQTSKPTLIKDISEAPNFKLIDGPNIGKIKSQIAVPLVFKKHIIGIIYADNLTRTNAFSQKNLDLLESIGNQLAGVIENARLLDQVMENHKQLQQSEKQYHSVVEDSPGLINRFTPDGTITFVNQEYCKFFGKKYDEMIGMNIQSTIIEEDKEKVMSSISSLTKESPIRIFENRVIRHEGEIRWVRWTDRALFDDKGQVISYQSFGEDITEQMRAEKKLKISEERFRAFMENVPAFAYILNKDLRHIYGNPASIAADGYSSLDDYIGTSIRDRYPDKISDEIEANSSRVLGEGCITRHEFTAAKPDGKLQTFLDTKFPIQLPDGGIQVGGLAIDITEMKEAQKVILEERDKAQKYLDIAEVMILAIDNEGEITLVNQKGASILGYQIEELIGKNWFNTCVPPADRKQAKKIFDKFIAVGGALGDHFEQTIMTKEGKKRIIDWNSTQLWVWDDGVKHRIGSLSSGEDITERVLAQKAIRHEKEKAQKYLDIAGVAFVALNKKGEITLINQKGIQILGYEEDELTGVNWFDTCLPERNRKEVKGVFKKIMTGRDELVEFYENSVLTKSGEERIIAWHNTVIKDEKGNNIGTLGSGEDITERVWAEQLLDALNRAAVCMGTARTHQEIFDAVSEELKQLDISCMLFPIDDTQGKLITKYISYESTLLNTAEKLVGIKHEDFSFPIDDIDMYRNVVREKKTLFIDNSEQMIQQILPGIPKKLLAQTIKLLRVQKSISAPLIVEGQVIGVFSTQSDKLTQEDVQTATAFADQLSSAWNKIELLQNLQKTVEGAIHTIAATVEARDPYTAGHQKRVADLAAAIASEMHLSDEQVEGIRMAGVIHDLGKVQVPAEILSKPGKISELEYKIIQTHPQVGFDLLKGIEFPWPIAQMVLQHHEMMDGSGYPQGLKGEEIMLEARILSVADTVEAMSSHRPYRPALGVEKALNQIKQDKGTLFDPDVVDACLKIFEDGYKLPTG